MILCGMFGNNFWDSLHFALAWGIREHCQQQMRGQGKTQNSVFMIPGAGAHLRTGPLIIYYFGVLISILHAPLMSSSFHGYERLASIECINAFRFRSSLFFVPKSSGNRFDDLMKHRCLAPAPCDSITCKFFTHPGLEVGQNPSSPSLSNKKIHNTCPTNFKSTC